MLQSTCKVPIKIKQMTSLINKFSKITINVTIFLIPKTPSLTFIEVDSIVLIPILLEFGMFFLMKFSVDYSMICYHFETVWLICEIEKLQNGNKPNTSNSLADVNDRMLIVMLNVLMQFCLLPCIMQKTRQILMQHIGHVILSYAIS